MQNHVANSVNEITHNSHSNFVHEISTVFRTELFHSHDLQNIYKTPNWPKFWLIFMSHMCQNRHWQTTTWSSFFLVSNVNFVLQITSLLATVTRRVTGGMPTDTTPNTRILPTGLEWCNGSLQASCGSCYIAVGTHRAKLLANSGGMMLMFTVSGAAWIMMVMKAWTINHRLARVQINVWVCWIATPHSIQIWGRE